MELTIITMTMGTPTRTITGREHTGTHTPIPKTALRGAFTMRPFRALTILALAFIGANARPALAQDLVISNARIIVGTGQVIERGSIVIRNGRIVSAGA